MKFLNILTLAFITGMASAAAVPGGTTTNDAASTLDNLNNKRSVCGQLCFNNKDCGGPCPKCNTKEGVCVKK
ncbi:uncharacterized protein ACLA_083080 [Aspergillus clavatus NRRL 1]|uniref:UPF0499 protein ACLA_083080 n=1 Tax=Aspergillus clavatus (strain ATCC 1007 / CBS 513.65 / DSM 816 / NCTC 3887 / NRRL 1 / QM 1276 / 107) TaxID=344612 RepID=U499_ASPCL|nr:uncharacterized protein ACLA_083080 [Aspergillus clavatus NRRL 1]A1CTH7.1 RecName: Full=UPF0499 protein ACLA_083080; Flags: Precursor [Aspergillus clavatus NRRL 1]EAW06614.1 hypothetical protein ACLA_083080 [Aspergillus clavatus NRRL 1]